MTSFSGPIPIFLFSLKNVYAVQPELFNEKMEIVLGDIVYLNVIGGWFCKLDKIFKKKNV